MEQGEVALGVLVNNGEAQAARLSKLRQAFWDERPQCNDEVSGKMLRTLINVFATLVLGYLLSMGSLVYGQTKEDPYPAMAPIDQYLIGDQNVEIQLARSAAPASISNNADVVVLRRQGYQAAAHGSNGFVCLVERSWAGSFDDPEFWNPRIRSPICFNPPAARSVLPLTYKKTAMALRGFSKAQMAKGLKDAMLNKEIPAVEVGAMSYMMSRAAFLGDAIGYGPAHLMFFGPDNVDGAGWGENLPGSPVMRLPDSAADPAPVRTYIVLTSTWSDGKAAAATAHRH